MIQCVMSFKVLSIMGAQKRESVIFIRMRRHLTDKNNFKAEFSIPQTNSSMKTKLLLSVDHCITQSLWQFLKRNTLKKYLLNGSINDLKHCGVMEKCKASKVKNCRIVSFLSVLVISCAVLVKSPASEC